MQTTTITIQGRDFSASLPYSAGHTLTEGEAAALNQVRLENLRNNFATQMKRAKEEASPHDLTQEDFDKYAEQYKFGVRVGGAKLTVDPIKREAIKLAKIAVIAALKRKKEKDPSFDPKAVSDEQFDELVEGLIAKDARFMEQAQAIVTARKTAIAEVDI